MFRRGKNGTGSGSHDGTGARASGNRGRRTLHKPLESGVLLSADPLLAVLSHHMDEDAARTVEPDLPADVPDGTNPRTGAVTATEIADLSAGQRGEDRSGLELPAELAQQDRASLDTDELISEPSAAVMKKQGPVSATLSGVVAEDSGLLPSMDDGLWH